MSNVINIWDAKKKIAKKSNDSAGYNFAEVMRKNQEAEEKRKQERLKETQQLADYSKTS